MRTRALPGLALTPRTTATILRRLAAERAVALVVGRPGSLSVRSLAGYERRRQVMQKKIRTIRPWEKRRRDPLWPIGSKPLGITGKLTREEIYADD
jgi:hypothetical protein